MEIVDPETGFYFISEVRSSYASVWGSHSLAISLLTIKIYIIHYADPRRVHLRNAILI